MKGYTANIYKVYTRYILKKGTYIVPPQQITRVLFVFDVRARKKPPRQRREWSFPSRMDILAMAYDAYRPSWHWVLLEEKNEDHKQNISQTKTLAARISLK